MIRNFLEIMEYRHSLLATGIHCTIAADGDYSYVYTYVRARDGHATIAGRNVYTGHAARNGLSGHDSPRLAFEAGSHERQTRDRP